jgi:hypothetical protein
MWDPRRLTTLWVSVACYKGNFTFTFIYFALTVTDHIFLSQLTEGNCSYNTGYSCLHYSLLPKNVNINMGPLENHYSKLNIYLYGRGIWLYAQTKKMYLLYLKQGCKYVYKKWIQERGS